MSPKEIRDKLQHGFDSVSKGKDGVWTVKRSFFYRLGMSEDKLAERVLGIFPDAQVVEKREEWRSWPKTSYFVVRFTIPEVQERKPAESQVAT